MPRTWTLRLRNSMLLPRRRSEPPSRSRQCARAVDPVCARGSRSGRRGRRIHVATRLRILRMQPRSAAGDRERTLSRLQSVASPARGSPEEEFCSLDHSRCAELPKLCVATGPSQSHSFSAPCRSCLHTIVLCPALPMSQTESPLRVVHAVCSHDCPDSCAVLVSVDASGRAHKDRRRPQPSRHPRISLRQGRPVSRPRLLARSPALSHAPPRRCRQGPAARRT